MSAAFAALGLNVRLQLGAATSMQATLVAPKGPIRLSSIHPLAISIP
jgi:hypothetical protein